MDQLTEWEIFLRPPSIRAVVSSGFEWFLADQLTAVSAKCNMQIRDFLSN